MARLTCACCGIFVANVWQAYAGLLPSQTRCPDCSIPARQRTEILATQNVKWADVCPADDLQVIS